MHLADQAAASAARLALHRSGAARLPARSWLCWPSTVDWSGQGLPWPMAPALPPPVGPLMGAPLVGAPLAGAPLVIPAPPVWLPVGVPVGVGLKPPGAFMLLSVLPAVGCRQLPNQFLPGTCSTFLPALQAASKQCGSG